MKKNNLIKLVTKSTLRIAFKGITRVVHSHFHAG